MIAGALRRATRSGMMAADQVLPARANLFGLGLAAHAEHLVHRGLAQPAQLARQLLEQLALVGAAVSSVAIRGDVRCAGGAAIDLDVLVGLGLARGHRA